MKIILLSGQPNTGKTTTLNDLYNDLIAKGASVHIVKLPLGGKSSNDFECVLKISGKLVAIYSMGDYIASCYEAIIKYAYCDVLVLAYSDKFKNSIATVVGSCPHHVVVNKTIGSNQVQNNQMDVATISSNIP